jgi:hypothetical protein
MKAKMKKLISIKSMPLLALVLPIVSGFTLAPPGREPISICGVVDLDDFSGTAIVVVGGEAISGTVQVVPLQEPIPKDGGLYFPVVEHWFMFDTGSLVTTGEEFAMPTDENSSIATLHGNMEIIRESVTGMASTSGAFEGASGELRVNGQMDWPPISGQATFNAKGTISR